MSSELVALAQKLVALDAEAEGVRNQMRVILANGLGDPRPGHPTRHAPRRAQSPSRKEVLGQSAARDAQALEAIRSAPSGLTRREIQAATGGATSTLQNRLARLEAQGLVQRGEDGAWISTSTPT
jgi:hypothetical protein